MLNPNHPEVPERGFCTACLRAVIAAVSAVASTTPAIYIDRCMAKKRAQAVRKGQRILSGGRKRVLVVLFIPSVERDGMSMIDNRSG
jgi:hypothetical protein